MVFVLEGLPGHLREKQTTPAAKRYKKASNNNHRERQEVKGVTAAPESKARRGEKNTSIGQIYWKFTNLV